jgi:hypothetical protein
MDEVTPTRKSAPCSMGPGGQWIVKLSRTPSQLRPTPERHTGSAEEYGYDDNDRRVRARKIV